MRASSLGDILRDAGQEVSEESGWNTRDYNNYGLTGTLGIMWHHTASPPSSSDSGVIGILRDGRSDLPGPLCHLGLARNGTWHVIAAGRANHAGTGSWPGLNGNRDIIGIECFYTGTSAEEWSRPQLAALRAGTAALCKALDIDPVNVIGHKEWAPRRKIDPYGLDMAQERETVRSLMAGDASGAGAAEPDPSAEPRWAGPWQHMRDAGIFSEHTKPGTPVDTDALAAFMSRLLNHLDGR